MKFTYKLLSLGLAIACLSGCNAANTEIASSSAATATVDPATDSTEVPASNNVFTSAGDGLYVTTDSGIYELQTVFPDSANIFYVNSLITSVKKELSVRSSTTAVPDIDLYQILMNQHKVQVFHDVVKMIKKPRIIQAQNLYSYRVVAQSSPFSGALAMQKVSRSKTVFSDAFKEYNDPYKFLQVLKGKDIPASEYYKYFVNITYEVFNQYGSPASGGERSEYNLLQELSDGVKNSILILDEPESSFDNIFLRDGVDSLLKDISKTIPVIIATHNNTIGVSVHPDYIVYACKEVLSDGKLEYHLYSGYPSSEDLVDLKGNHISRKSVLLDCLEAGEAAYMDRRNSYEILNG